MWISVFRSSGRGGSGGGGGQSNMAWRPSEATLAPPGYQSRPGVFTSHPPASHTRLAVPHASLPALMVVSAHCLPAESLPAAFTSMPASATATENLSAVSTPLSASDTKVKYLSAACAHQQTSATTTECLPTAYPYMPASGTTAECQPTACTPIPSTTATECPPTAYTHNPAPAAATTRHEIKPAVPPQLPITPPSKFKRFKIFMKLARKERRKRDEGRGCGEGGARCSNKADHNILGQSVRHSAPYLHQDRPRQTPRCSIQGKGVSSQRERQNIQFPNSSRELGVLNLKEEQIILPRGSNGGAVVRNQKGGQYILPRGSFQRPGIHKTKEQHNVLPRRSSREVGDRNPRERQNILPLWLEEGSGSPPEPAVKSSAQEQILVPDNDSSFETRWDSLRGKNKVHSSCWTGQRPPGWEDVGYAEVARGKRNINTDARNITINDIPSFSSQNVGSDGANDLHSASAPPCEVFVSNFGNDVETHSGQSTAGEMQPTNYLHQNFSDSFVQTTNRNTSDTTIQAEHHTFSYSVVQVQQHSDAISNVASDSAENCEGTIMENEVSSKISDRHLWASSDSFYCEDFTFCDKKIKYEHGNIASQPRSYSEVLLHQNRLDSSREQSDNSLEKLDYSLGDTEGEPSCASVVDMSHRVSYSSDALTHTSGEDNVLDTPPLDSLSLNESSCDSSDRAHSTPNDNDCDVPHGSHNVTSDSTLSSEAMRRQSWVEFESGSLECLEQYNHAAKVISPQRILPQDNKMLENQISVDQQDLDESSPASPSTDNHRKFILSSKESSMSHSSASYGGRLIRTYSQRGRRASKRVINSVSRKMSVHDYGKVPEPSAPMYSKAVLTMHSGPGLFEQATATSKDDSDSDHTDPLRTEEPSREESSHANKSEKRAQKNKETKKAQTIKDETNAHKNTVAGKSNSPHSATASRSFLEPAKAMRVGSLRLPRLPAALVRRSVSFNTPKVERGEVPFQRLPERRPGSFRKAMGALARSFRRKSSDQKVEADTTAEGNEKTNDKVNTRGLIRSGSFGRGGGDRQTPQAPRLPRRADVHKFGALQSNPSHLPSFGV